MANWKIRRGFKRATIYLRYLLAGPYARRWRIGWLSSRPLPLRKEASPLAIRLITYLPKSTQRERETHTHVRLIVTFHVRRQTLDAHNAGAAIINGARSPCITCFGALGKETSACDVDDDDDDEQGRCDRASERLRGEIIYLLFVRAPLNAICRELIYRWRRTIRPSR